MKKKIVNEKTTLDTVVEVVEGIMSETIGIVPESNNTTKNKVRKFPGNSHQRRVAQRKYLGIKKKIVKKN